MGKFIWPEGYQSAAIFTFDVDASCAQQFVEGTTLGSHSVGDYGPKVGLPRILNLLDKYGLKAIFFVPAWVAERFPERIKEVHVRGHEVGSHGYLHENLLLKSEEEEREIHDRSLKILSDIVGSPPRIFRSPGGPFTAQTVKFLLERGYDGDSTSGEDYFPFKVKLDGKEVDMVELPTNWITVDSQHFRGGVHSSAMGSTFLPICAPDEVIDYWIAEFDGTHELGGLFVALNHPLAIGRVSRLRMLEVLLRHIKATPGVWITTAREVINWTLKR